MSNRSLIIHAKAREEYIDETELLKRSDTNRDKLMAEMMIRLQSVIIAVKAQANFKPTVKMRMASFATFLLRVGRQWDWGVAAQQTLDAWQEEQEGSGLDDSIVETLNHWMAEKEWDKSRRYSAGDLHRELVNARVRYNMTAAWWYDKGPALIRNMRSAKLAYRWHFGFLFDGRTSGHKPAVYWFDPTIKTSTEPIWKMKPVEPGKPVEPAEPGKQEEIPF